MAFLKGIFISFLLSGILSGLIWQFGYKIYPSPEVPKLKDNWWSSKPKETSSQDDSIRPFKINVADETLIDLKKRLESVRLTQPLDGVHFEYGFNTNYLKEVIAYWKDKYDWKKEENRLNKFEGFKTQIDGIDVHFWHVKPKSVPKDVKIIPLLLSHGWPGSLEEFFKVLPMLTTPKKKVNFVFEVVCPHIPGYGFSEAPHKPGFGPMDAAQTFDKLMVRLGFTKYYVQGGDWGCIITTYMAIFFPNRVSGLHVNFAVESTTGQLVKTLIGQWFPSLVFDDKDRSLMYPFLDKILLKLRETGYMHLQATKPDTVGVALGDSPAGLAAYILEKFSTWTNTDYDGLDDGGITKKFTLDELLTNVMIYWVTGSITSSMRFYKEYFLDHHYKLRDIPVTVPTGIAAFPNEFFRTAKSVVHHQYANIIQYTDMERGGHFAAFEEPALIADDIYSFVSKVEELNIPAKKM